MNTIDLTQVDLNLLVDFEAVFGERHVGRAAARLHLTSSAVSHGLGRLRELFADPLFLRIPKGVMPTARAAELAPSVADVLTRVRGVLGSVEPFSAKSSTRRFTLGMPDSSAAVLLPPLLSTLAREAPGIDLSIRHLLPQDGVQALDQGSVDLVVLALDDAPARFSSKVAWEEEFVIAARASHPFLKAPSLRRYCAQKHMLVSITGDPAGFLDQALAEKGLSRRVALSVPNFMLALAALADSDLLAALPNSLLAAHGERFGLGSVKAPLPLRRWQLRAVAPHAALTDPGVAWLFDAIDRAARARARLGRPRRGGHPQLGLHTPEHAKVVEDGACDLSLPRAEAF
jgi:DNA-binding transcriptional LysR family regulator